MEPIPKPLLRRLVLTFLTGGSCFLIGLVFFLQEGDMPFFTLSILFFLQVKKKTTRYWRASARMSA